MQRQGIDKPLDSKSDIFSFPLQDLRHVLNTVETFLAKHQNVFDRFDFAIDDDTHAAPLLDRVEDIHVFFRAQSTLEKVQNLPVQ